MEIKKCKCKCVLTNGEKCGHEWWPRTNRVPVQCPKCKNTNWNKSQKNKSKK